MSGTDFSQFSMQDLFRIEAENQVKILTAGLLALERDATAPVHLEACMRAAHSLKGAARIVDLPQCIIVAHAMEDLFVAAQRGQLRLTRGNIDILLQGVDLITEIAAAGAPGDAASPADARIASFADNVSQMTNMPAPEPEPTPVDSSVIPPEEARNTGPEPSSFTPGRMVRVNSDNLNRLLGLAGEQLMEAKSRQPFNDAMLRLKRAQNDLSRGLGDLLGLMDAEVDEAVAAELAKARRLTRQCQDDVAAILADLDAFDRRAVDLANRLL